jgi:protein-S-isoprenylcysteine O-methyltransferase Ste14
MIPMLAATAVAFSSPLVLLVALVLYVGGTRIRIASEERLMASAFGDEWTTYRARVRALVPLPR